MSAQRKTSRSNVQLDGRQSMGDLEIHTVNGWVKLEDVILAQETCSKCGKEDDAEGAGFISTDPIVFHCRQCRTDV